MIRALSFVAVLAALPAWAVGEHVAVTGPAKDQLTQTICISMECKGGRDYTVSSKLVGGQMELKVTGPDGTVRHSMKVPLNDAQQLSNSELMSATSLLIHAIENPLVAKAAAPEPKAKATSKAKKLAKAKKKSVSPVRVAARMRSRG